MSSSLEYTSWDETLAIHQTLSATFASGLTRSLKWRKWQLKQLWWLVTDNQPAISAAMAADLRRHEIESVAFDISNLQKDIQKTLAALESYARDDRITDSGLLMRFVCRARVRKEPLGVSLIIGAWNFPFLLLLQPLIAALAAGCCVLLKPSELADASQRLIVDLVARYLDPRAVRVVTGAGPEMARMLAEVKFDQIFFTGSTGVGRRVAEAAARKLTPVVLELGGQDPAIVCRSAHVDLSAKRIALSKFMNGGQICLSVNHVFVDPEIHDEFVERLKYWTQHFASGGDKGTDGGMCKIVNERNYKRLAGLLESTKGEVFRANVPEIEGVMTPAVITGIDNNDPILSEELFGPFCPVIKASSSEAIKFTNARPRPLALYIFSNDKSEVNHIMDTTISGGVTINDAILHYSVPTAPFGGVGDSGYGAYHGVHGFLAFSHRRTVITVPRWLESLLAGRYPPYDVAKRGKFAVKNSGGFRRGETMEDQHEKDGWIYRVKELFVKEKKVPDSAESVSSEVPIKGHN
ncbi:hypothetical protein TD95_005022 [Thielaviopsis punctulata]|uniref:Aldehyde dehydrogenase n=1 Tax=Thielaviopsis punctulata TaxID=72032 RepID=A0A0F4ZFN6_9PEZI|nr:hypothetical protein TD95_005022 [Thielaviopsis punctulata]